MGTRIVALAGTALLALASSVSAQQDAPPTLSPLQVAIACAPLPALAPEPADLPRIRGSQDLVQRSVFGMPELLVIDAGTARGFDVNRWYFVRRSFRTAETHSDNLPHSVQTVGWVRIVAANATMAIATTEHTCAEMKEGDYLNAFRVPDVPDDLVGTPIIQTDLDFAAFTRVLYGDYDRHSSSVNEFVMIDHGLDRGIRIGAQFAIYRDLQVSKVPLTIVGEAMAMAVGPTMTLVRITKARDAVFAGDVMVPRRKDVVSAAPVAPASRGARAVDIDALVASAIRELTEYRELMAADAPAQASDRLKAAGKTVDQLQKVKP